MPVLGRSPLLAFAFMLAAGCSAAPGSSNELTDFAQQAGTGGPVPGGTVINGGGWPPPYLFYTFNPVTGGGSAAQGTSSKGTQSESSIAVTTAPVPNPLNLPAQMVAVAFNDWAGVHRDSSGNLLPGSSYIGHSYSSDNGSTFSYKGTVPTPAKFSNFVTLRGDPNLAASIDNPGNIYLVSLANTSSDLVNGAVPSGSDGVGGLCAYKSSDGGQTFAPLACVQAPNGGSYDGTSVAVGWNEVVYISSVRSDAISNHIDVWQLDGNNTVNGNPTLLADPFPGVLVSEHPRIKIDPQANVLYAMALGSCSLQANQFNGTSWSSPTSIATGNFCIDTDNVSFSSAGSVRRARFFDFDIADPAVGKYTCWGRACFHLPDTSMQVRIAWTAPAVSGGMALGVAVCSAALGNCHEVTQWEPSLPVGGQYFEPVVRAYHSGGEKMNPLVELGWLSVTGPAAFDMINGRMDLAKAADGTYTVPVAIAPVLDYPGENVCPHTAPGGGYLGDYNDMQAITVNGAVEFVHTFTWSPALCSTNKTSAGADQHVGAEVFVP